MGGRNFERERKSWGFGVGGWGLGVWGLEGGGLREGGGLGGGKDRCLILILILISVSRKIWDVNG